LADERRGRIRLAYFSGELRNHATAHLFAGALERHDKARFEVTVFNLELRDGSPLQQRIVDAVDDFIDVHGLGGERLVKLIRDKRIDILVNLDFSNDELPNSVFLQRPAPVQVNYLGHPGTAALGGCDYLVADSVVIPPEQKRHYLEKIVYLPDCYQANSSHEIAARPMRRAEWGLPEQGFVFCGFNRNLKLNPDTLDGWSRILLASPGSALWLLQDSFTAVANLRKEAAARGVDPARLVFAERVSSAEHLARHRLADLFLDTLPYNAHTTVSDALWAGVPALTRIGETFAGRVGASVLAAVGLPELVVDTQEAYEATAIDLAANPDRLSALREKLARNLPTAPLFDAKLFATRLQTAYEAMHARRLAGLPPDDIVVPA
jgi:predicted O-linked N-acetylglucosamine transferase (SPINDLY family)